MDTERIARAKTVLKWLAIIVYLVAVGTALVNSWRNNGFINTTTILLLLAFPLPLVLYIIAKLGATLKERRMQVDVASDHTADLSLFSEFTIVHLLLGIGLVVSILFVIFIPPPWNLFVLLGGAFLIFSSIRTLS